MKNILITAAIIIGLMALLAMPDRASADGLGGLAGMGPAIFMFVLVPLGASIVAFIIWIKVSTKYALSESCTVSKKKIIAYILLSLVLLVICLFIVSTGTTIFPFPFPFILGAFVIVIGTVFTLSKINK